MKLTVGGAFSKENFYRATTGLMSVARDFANGNTTVAGGFAFSLNQPTLHPLPDVENQYQRGGFGSVTQVLSRTTIVEAGYEVGQISGYLNNPYLRANVDGVMVLGQVPDSRIRQTLSARLRQGLPADTYLEADYRRYLDDWQVQSNTFSVGVSHHFGSQFLMNLAFRRYDQTGAFFWAPEYTGIPQVLHGRLPARALHVEQLLGARRVHAKAAVVAARRSRGDRTVRALSGGQWLQGGDRFDWASRAVESPHPVERFHALEACQTGDRVVRIRAHGRLLEWRPSGTGDPFDAVVDRYHPNDAVANVADPTAGANDNGGDSRLHAGSAAGVQRRLRALPRDPIAGRSLFDDDLFRRDGGSSGRYGVECARRGHSARRFDVHVS